MNDKAISHRGRRGCFIFYGLLLVLVIASIASNWVYDQMIWWPNDCLFGILDESWKLLLAVWIGLRRASVARSCGKLVLGATGLWVLVNFWAIASLRLAEYVESSQQVGFSIWRTAFPPAIAAACFRFLSPLKSYQLAWLPDSPRQDSRVQFSLKSILASVFVVACFYGVGSAMKSHLDSTSIAALLMGDLLKFARLAVVGIVVIWLVFLTKSWLSGAGIVIGVSLALGLVVPAVFPKGSSLIAWTAYLIGEPIALLFVFSTVRYSGWRLIAVEDANHSLGEVAAIQ